MLYIIKQSRTYDQVLVDFGKGNGDQSLTVFGEKVTPKHHEPARQFVLLDKSSLRWRGKRGRPFMVELGLRNRFQRKALPRNTKTPQDSARGKNPFMGTARISRL